MPAVGFVWKKMTSGDSYIVLTIPHYTRRSSTASPRAGTSVATSHASAAGNVLPVLFAFVVQIMMMMADAGTSEQELLFRAGGRSIAPGSTATTLLTGVCILRQRA